MRTIDVDFDVFKALTMRRSSESVSENDVLRQLLGLPPASSSASAETSTRASPADWVTKGIRFPAGAEFRATHKGQTYLARVEAGALVLGGRRFTSPSSAAVSITKTNINGWRFWQFRFPGQTSWRSLDSLRHRSA
jgi:hypothetical protein